MCQWICEDGRSVVRTAPPLDEFDNPIGNSSYYLYGDEAPKRINEIFWLSGRIILWPNF